MVRSMHDQRLRFLDGQCGAEVLPERPDHPEEDEQRRQAGEESGPPQPKWEGVSVFMIFLTRSCQKARCQGC